MVEYNLIHADSLVFLGGLKNGSLPVVVTGLPDMEELGISDINKYLEWFNGAADLLFRKVHPDGYLIFIQTDRKKNSEWIDKSFFLTRSGYNNNYRLLWHKICLNRPVDSINLHRPTYSHILAYSVNGKPGASFADTILAGKRLYDNATPLNALKVIMTFLSKVKLPKSEFPDITDPFVGQGSVIYMARQFGFTSLGIDIDVEQIQKADDFLSNS